MCVERIYEDRPHIFVAISYIILTLKTIFFILLEAMERTELNCPSNFISFFQ